LQPKGLICPTALKRAIARKGQFRKLSNLPPLPDKPIAADAGIDSEHLPLQAASAQSRRA
jgi:hypothetical protein